MKKSVVGFLAAAIGVATGAAVVNYYKNKKLVEKANKVDKFKGYYNMLNQWLVLKNEGKKLDKYFIHHGYKTIAIYGMGELGNRLYEELRNSEIEVKYAIDKKADSTYSELDVYNLEDGLEEVDVVVVTAIFDYEKIEEELENVLSYPIISLEDVVFEL